MLPVFKTKGFARFARRERIADQTLCDAIHRAERGAVDADLGGGVIKQRVPRPGQGRSGGFRSLILYRTSERAIFIDRFAKNERDNIDDSDLERLRELASEFLSYNGRQITSLVEAGAWIEVECHG